MSKLNIKKLTFAGILVAVGVILSTFYIPVGASKCIPIQHFINVLAAVLLGPAYGVSMAFVTSCIRIMMGTGSLLAFPGSMGGALCAGLLFKYSKNLYLALFGELFGTGILGALLSYPIAAYLMGKEAAVLGYIAPFMLSSFGGVVLAFALLKILQKSHVLEKLTSGLEH